MKTRLKEGDEVVVISGKAKGSKGRLLRIQNNRVWVQGANFRLRATPPSQENPKGGFMEIESSMHITNIQLLDPKSKKGSRIAYSKNKEGKKVRVSVTSGKVIE